MIITDSASAAAASVTQDWADSGSIEKQRDTGSPPPPPSPTDGGEPSNVVPNYAPTISFAPPPPTQMQIPGALPMPSPEPVGAVSNPTYYQPTSPTYGQENAPSGGTGIGGYLGNIAQGGYTGVNQTVDLASRYGGEAGGFLGSHVYTNPIGGGLGGDTGVTTPKQRQEIGKVGEIGGGIAPMAAAYAVAPEIGVPTTVLDAYFAARGLQGAKSTWDAYQSGQIDAKTALTQALVQDLPNLIPAGIHGIRLAPEIKATVERLSQTPEAQGALKFAASERGSLGTPPEPPKGPNEGPYKVGPYTVRTRSAPGEPGIEVSFINESGKVGSISDLRLMEAHLGDLQAQHGEVYAIAGDERLRNIYSKLGFESQGASALDPTMPTNLMKWKPAETGAAGAGQPPPPSEPSAAQRVSSVTGEVIPPVNAKLIQALTDVNQSLADRAQQVKAGHARQIGAMGEALGTEGSATERLQAASRARAGALLPEVPGIGDNFSPEEIDQLHGQITGAFDRGEINENQAANAYGIVRDMMNPPEGYKGPQPAERQLIARVFGPEVAQSIPKLGSPAWSPLNELRAIPSAWKLMLTSFSEHGPLNQMFRLGVSNWGEWAKGWAAQLRNFRDVDAAAAWHDTSARPWRTGQGLPSGVLGSEEAGLQLHDPTGGEFGQRAESFQLARDSYIGRAITSIPGVSQSKNAFLTGINTFRQAMYEKLAQRAMQAGNRDPEFYKSLADYVNKGTGWGSLPEGGARTFAQALFSPRNWVSKFQWPMEVFSKDATIRKQAARDLAGYATAVGGLLTVAKLAGPQVGLDAVVDPRSGRFGQIRLGTHYVNPLRDYSPIIKLAAQLGTRQTIAQTTTGPAAFPTDFKQAIENYLKGPESPIIGLASDLISGTNSAGQQISYTPGGLKTEAFNRLVPIFAREVAEGIRSPDPIHTAFSAPVALFGGSAGSYTTPSEDVFNARQAWAKSAGYSDYADASQKLGPNAAAVAARQSADVTKAEGTHQQQQEDLNTPAGQIRTAITQRMPAEDQNDQKLLAGQETGQQWRDARKLILANQAGAIAQIVNSTGLTDKPTGDPLIDGYFKVFSDYTDPKTGLVADQAALSDALDGYRSKLSPDDQKRLDANTDTGQVTPLVQQYRQVTKQLSDAGWFDLASNLYKQGGLDKYAPDIGAFIQKYGKLPPRFNTALGKLRLKTLIEHPELAKGAVQFGFATSGGAKKFAGTQP